jgi:uncharacterized protein YunC (DUF1805 family)
LTSFVAARHSVNCRERSTSRRSAFVAGMVVNAVLCFNDLIASGRIGVVTATAAELGVAIGARGAAAVVAGGIVVTQAST